MCTNIVLEPIENIIKKSISINRYSGGIRMRVIYLSAAKEKGDFGNRKIAIEFFMRYLNGIEKYFDYNHRKIDKKRFYAGEDVIFLRPLKNNEGNLTYEIIACCRSASGIFSNYDTSAKHRYYFAIDTKTLKIFKDGIDIELLNRFVFDEKINGITKDNFFTDNIKDNKIFVSHGWTHFNKEDSKRIMDKFRAIVFERYNIFRQYQ